MTIGDTNLPRSKPNLNHNLFGIINVFGKKILRKKKKIEIKQDQ